MSVAVPIAELSTAIDEQIGWCYLLTVSDGGQPRVLAVAAQNLGDGMLRFEVGSGTAANIAARSSVTLVFPPAAPDAMSLIVDGAATVDEGTASFVASRAVKHRSAI